MKHILVKADHFYHLLKNKIQSVLKILYWLFSGQLSTRLERRRIAKLVRNSDLFDTEYYWEQNPDIKDSGIDPLGHYLDNGASQGKNPNPLFDTSYYLTQYPDVAISELNPLAHYLMIGSQKGYNPHPLFSTSYYLQSNQDINFSEINPLLHYLRFGAAEGRDPFPCEKIQSSKLSIETIPYPNHEYQKWLNSHYPKQEDCEKIENYIKDLPYQPLVSLITVFLNHNHQNFLETIKSIIHQTYPKWELVIMATHETQFELDYISQKHLDIGSKLKIIFCSPTETKANIFNTALEDISGEFFGFLNPDDLLTPHALSEFVKLFNDSSDAVMVYSDEDTINEQHDLSSPYFKPDWCPDSFLSRMYTGKLAIYKQSFVQNIGGFRTGFDENEEYDLILRLSEKTDKIYHIPNILYHKRTYSKVKSKSQLNNEMAKKAIVEALARREEQGKVIEAPRSQDNYVVRYKINNYDLVSIIIPTKNLGEMLDRCLTSIFQKTTYPYFEIVIIDNGSTEKESLEIIQSWLKKESQRVRVLKLDIPFNYSMLNNFAVEKAKGKYLLFLNNDTEVITPDWLEGMVEQIQRPSVGAVGPLLLFPDDTIQHAGIIAGIFNSCGHGHKRFKLGESGYFNQLNTVNNYLAVTGACLMCRREIFDQVGGFDKIFAVNYNDIDLCFKIIDKGYRIVYLPHVLLYHYEAKSRGYDSLNNYKKSRFLCEEKYFQTKWKTLIEHDPCYNPNLTIDNEDYSLRV
ncbi:MAG: glycosyltransferase family 2 protein [Microcystaceae cyanobacterium]